MRRALPLIACALLLAACAGTGDDAGDAGGPTALEITLWPAGEGQGTAITATLACDPPAGDLPDPAAACAALAAEADALAPVPPDTACTMLYGGPEEARIAGTLDGAEVEVRLARVDGCQIDRWQRLLPVLPAYEPVPL